MIKFHFTSPTDDEALFFKDVKIHQFFVNESGYFCQKSGNASYSTIADPGGYPYACPFRYSVDPLTETVREILPLVIKIEFGRASSSSFLLRFDIK